MDRKRMGMGGGGPPAMDEAAGSPPAEAGPGEGEPMESPAKEGGEMPSVFMTRDELGGLQVKEGEEIIFKVKSVDPESGEAEMVYSTAPEKTGNDGSEEPPSVRAMDSAMPEEG